MEIKGKILVMDDQKEICFLLQKFLTKIGYHVEIAYDGDMALNFIKKSLLINDVPDLFLLDLIIPGKENGCDVLQSIKNFLPNAQAILMSGFSDRDIMKNPRSYGFIAAMNKPFQLDFLRRTISNALTEPKMSLLSH